MRILKVVAIAAVLFAGLVFFGLRHLMKTPSMSFEAWDRQVFVTAADLANATDLKGFSFNPDSDPHRETQNKTRVEGGLEFIYRFPIEGESPVNIDCVVQVLGSPQAAQAFLASRVPSQGFEEHRELITLPLDEVRVGFLVEGGVKKGNFVGVRKGGRVFTLRSTGAVLDKTAQLDALLVPRLGRMDAISQGLPR